jgi:hypothetical protein
MRLFVTSVCEKMNKSDPGTTCPLGYLADTVAFQVELASILPTEDFVTILDKVKPYSP